MTEVLVQVPKWLADSHGLATRELRGTIERSTERGLLFRGVGSARPTQHCLRCGQLIDNPISRQIGYGPICCEHLGIPRDFTQEQVEELRNKVAESVTFEGWLPRHKVTLYDLDGNSTAPPEPEPLQVKPIKVTVEDRRIFVSSPYRLKDVMQGAGGRWDRRSARYHWPSTPSSAKTIADALAAEVLDGDTAFSELLARAQEIKAAAVHKVDDDLEEIPGASDPATWMHQRQAFWFGKDLHALMLYMGMGAGKSRVTSELLRVRGAERVLILCPNNVQGVWPRELAKWDTERQWSLFVFGREKGSVKNRTTACAEAMKVAAARNQPFAVVINYEAAWRDDFANWAIKQRWDDVVADESHRLKSPSSRISMFASKLHRASERRLCLTGTPMGNGPLDIYGQFRYLDPGVFGQSYTRYRNRYAVMGGHGGHEILAFRTLPTLKNGRANPYYIEDLDHEWSEKFYSLTYEVGEEALDLPPLSDIERQCLLTPSGKRVYRDITDEMYAEQEGEEFSAPNVLTRVLRQQQITGGSVTSDSGETVIVDDSKRKLLKEVLEDLDPDEPVVVFCRFTHDLTVVREVADELKRPYGELSGNRKDALTDTSEMSPHVTIAGVQISAGGVGIDLTRSRYGIYYSLGHSLIDYQQSRKRIHRPGQERSTVLYHLVAAGTVDESVYKALSSKQEVVDYVRSRKEIT